MTDELANEPPAWLNLQMRLLLYTSWDEAGRGGGGEEGGKDREEEGGVAGGRGKEGEKDGAGRVGRGMGVGGGGWVRDVIMQQQKPR